MGSTPIFDTSRSFDRRSLVGCFDISLKVEAPDKKKRSIRVAVDRELARLFGARPFLGIDWNLSPRDFTLSEIEERLQQAQIPLSAQTLVTEELWTYKTTAYSYYFEELMDAEGNSFYRLKYGLVGDCIHNSGY